MPTNLKKMNVFLNALMSKTQLKENILEYLSSKINEVLTALLQGQPGVLDSDQITMNSAASNLFNLDVSNANQMVDGSGEVMTLTAGVVGETITINFENANGITYHVGIRYAQIEADVSLNARRGNAEYQTLQDTFGEVGNPDASPAPLVTGPGTGTNLRLYIDDLTEAGVTNAGRKARVWMSPLPSGTLGPQSAVPAVAFKDLDVGYDGVNNFIDIAYSVATPPLGQDVSANPPSTNRLDYKVLVKGPSVRRNTDLRLDSNYAYIGNIEGNDTGGGVTPTTFNLDDQIAVFLVTLDRAYDGIGSGAGNVITVDVDGKPVELRSFPASKPLRPDLKSVFDVKDSDGVRMFRLEPWGRVGSVPRLVDEFIYGGDWASAATAPKKYQAITPTGGTMQILTSSDYPDDGAGILELRTTSSQNSRARIRSASFNVDQRLPRLYCRVAVQTPTAEWNARIGFLGNLGFYGIRINGSTIEGFSDDFTTLKTVTLRGGISDGIFYDCYMRAKDSTTLEFWAGRSGDAMTTPVEIDITSYAWDFSNLTGSDRFHDAEADSVVFDPGAATGSTLLLDFWELWTQDAMRSYLP